MSEAPTIPMVLSTYRCGVFTLDPARHETRRGGVELSLPLKVFSCIVHLIENRDRAVGRDEPTARTEPGRFRLETIGDLYFDRRPGSWWRLER